MPQGNYLNAFRGPDLAQIDESRHRNALLRNTVERIPQANRSDDLAIASQDLSNRTGEQGLSQSRMENARRLVSGAFTAMADAPDPVAAGAQIIRSQVFQGAARELGIPLDQFTAVPGQDDPEQFRGSARSWAQAVGAGSNQRRVQSTHVLEDGTIAIVEADGTIRRTNERARNDLRFVEAGGGRGAFDPRTGEVSPITTATQEIDVAAEKAGAEAWARAAATAGVDLQKEQVGREGTLGVWKVAREGLLRGLAGTSTGPVQGLIPAITARQQIAEGAIAAISPVLKQLFRSAGEGVFTDRDQQLLNDMIPKRTDHPETVASKMQMIDAIIEAKLAAPTSIPSPSRPQPNAGGAPQVGMVQDGYRYLGGDPAQPSSWQQVQ